MTTLVINHAGESITTPELPGTMTLGDIKTQAVSSKWPELTNASILVNGSNSAETTTVSQLASGAVITFALPTGTKN